MALCWLREGEALRGYAQRSSTCGAVLAPRSCGALPPRLNVGVGTLSLAFIPPPSSSLPVSVPPPLLLQRVPGAARVWAHRLEHPLRLQR